VADPVLFEQVVKRAFSQRRKTLSNALKSLVTDAPAVLQAAGIDPRRRPETLDLPELARLVEQVAAARRAAGP
jgi:16S rRNA (adenine1518-N6/adenine1519-N6)-dimethyltransferase